MKGTKFLFFLIAFMMFGVIHAEIASGTCGSYFGKITWVLDDEGTLTLSGSGEMADYDPFDYSPWYKNRSQIKNLIISDGITHIGDYAFGGCSGLTSVTIPNSVVSIKEGAFYGCSGLISLTIPKSVTSIGDHAFEYCSGLTSIIIPNSVTNIGVGAFNTCSSLTSVTIPNSVTSIEYATFSHCI